MTKVVSRVALILLACFMLTACSPKTLEGLMNQSDNKKMLDQQVEDLLNSASGKQFKDIKWEAKNNDLTYSYYFAQDFTDEQVEQIKANMENQADTLKTTINSVKDQLEKATGIRPDSITYAYFDNAGNEIVKITQ